MLGNQRELGNRRELGVSRELGFEIQWRYLLCVVFFFQALLG